MNKEELFKAIEELDECKNNDEILQIVLDLKIQNADLSKMIEELKRQLIKECKEHQEAMQIADKRIKELENENADLSKIIEDANTRPCEELELYKRAFNVATMDLDLCRNHSQTLNDELVERVENLRNTILERIKEKMEG